MSGQRQPIELVLANGKKHLTKAEIEARRASEIGPLDGDLTPPAFLTKKQKVEFTRIAGQLSELKIMGETDVDALVVQLEQAHAHAVAQIEAFAAQGPEGRGSGA